MPEQDVNHRLLPVVSERACQSLCRDCGLCCDGTLFRRVPFDAGEFEALSELGFGIVHGSQPTYFTQPCSKLAGGSCSVYALRPSNCRDFRCRVLQRLDAGELSSEQALTLVRQATSLAGAPAQESLLEAEFRPKRRPGDTM